MAMNTSIIRRTRHRSCYSATIYPDVVEAVAAQLPKGVHYGASHELEIEWAELIHELIPSAERIRFTNTGTEATHLALRIARAFTGKNKIIRFSGPFPRVGTTTSVSRRAARRESFPALSWRRCSSSADDTP